VALASGGSVLEPTGIDSIGHRRSSQQLLTEATHAAPPAIKTLPRKPDTAPQQQGFTSSGSVTLYLQMIAYSFQISLWAELPCLCLPKCR